MNRHPFDVLSFLFGLLFTALAGAWLLTEESIDPDLTDWFWPAVLVVGGAIVLASTLRTRGSETIDMGGTSESDPEDGSPIV